MKHGLHIMLQRFVRSTVSTAPRPNLISARAVMMNVLVLGRLEIAAVKERFDPFQKLRVGREHVLEIRRASGRSFAS